MDRKAAAYWCEFEKSIVIPEGIVNKQAEIICASGWNPETDGLSPITCRHHSQEKEIPNFRAHRECEQCPILAT